MCKTNDLSIKDTVTEIYGAESESSDNDTKQSTKKLKLWKDDDFHDDGLFDNNYYERKENNETTSQQLQSSLKSQSNDSQMPCSSKSIENNGHKVSCPICHNRYALNAIQMHVDTCAQKFDHIFHYSKEEDDVICDLEKTRAYIEDPAILSHPEAVKQRNSNLEKLEEYQNLAKNEIFKCRRQHAWKDVTAQRQKPWPHPNNTLVVTFLKESAVVAGGPRRKFFSGK